MEVHQSQNKHLSGSNKETKCESKNVEDFGTSSVTGFLLSILSSSTNPSKCKADPQSTKKRPSQTQFPSTVIADASTSASGGSQNGNVKQQYQESVESLQGLNQSFSSDGVGTVFKNLMQETQSSSTIALTLPPMSDKSLLLSEMFRTHIYSALPNIVKGRHWIMLYSTEKHGISLRTLYRKCSALSEPFLVVVGDFHGVTFGGLVTAPLQPAAKPKYLGTSDTFVFTNVHQNPAIFKATGANRYFILCLKESISFGGGGCFALHLSEDLSSLGRVRSFKLERESLSNEGVHMGDLWGEVAHIRTSN